MNLKPNSMNDQGIERKGERNNPVKKKVKRKYQKTNGGDTGYHGLKGRPPQTMSAVGTTLLNSFISETIENTEMS